jgi:hypothetical protein
MNARNRLECLSLSSLLSLLKYLWIRPEPSDITQGWPLAFLTNITLGWKGSRGPNTLAYYGHSQITAVKGYITLKPGEGSP